MIKIIIKTQVLILGGAHNQKLGGQADVRSCKGTPPGQRRCYSQMLIFLLEAVIRLCPSWVLVAAPGLRSPGGVINGWALKEISSASRSLCR